MKKLSFILFFIPFFLKAQERISRPTAHFTPNIIGEITNAKGWILNNEERWISRDNRIPIDSDPILIDYEKYKPGIDNFIYIQLREIVYKKDTSIILIKKLHDGFYVYPAIEKEWNHMYNCFYWSFTKSDFNDLKFYFDSTAILEIPVYQFGWTGLETKFSNELSLISRDFNSSETIQSSSHNFYLQYHIMKSKGIARFLLYSYEEYSSRNGNYWGFNNSISDAKNLKLYPPLSKLYYETSLIKFKKLFMIK